MSDCIYTTIDNAILVCFQGNYSILDSANIDTISNIINDYFLKNNFVIDMNSIKNRVSKITRYRNKLSELKELPYIKQRTIEWLELRKNRLTASDLYDAIKDNVSQNLIMKKANILVDNTNYSCIPALKWGTMFENMATRCYSQANYNINIQEFGLICDKRNCNFGASPDGINELGIMIEIKCPYSRKIIDNFIPVKYYTQIQGQLAVCELEECDYIECDFESFNTIEEYLSNIKKDSIINHGVIVEYKTANKDFYYLYSESYLSPDDAVKNARNQISTFKNPENYSYSKIIPWKLNEMKVQRVKFDEKEWQNTDNKITSFWELVEKSKKGPMIVPPKRKKIKFIDDDDSS